MIKKKGKNLNQDRDNDAMANYKLSKWRELRISK